MLPLFTCELVGPEAAGNGMDFVKRLDGEFALALFDFELRQLVLARDGAMHVRAWEILGS